MTLPNLNLDDKTFKELVEEAKKHIPLYAPEWTDYSTHDPGMTLIELFAWITEMQLYYLNQITEENKKKFLKILGELSYEDEKLILKDQDGNLILDELISRARKNIDKTGSAITPEDYEYLVYDYLTDENKTKYRVKAISDLKHQIMKVVVIPKISPEKNYANTDFFKDYDSLYDEIYSHLDEYRLIGTPLYVGGAKLVGVFISAKISVKDRYDAKKVIENVENSLKKFLDPFDGGTLRKGWPFGRGVFKSEIYKILNGVDGVGCVQNLEIKSPDKSCSYDEGNLSIPNIGLAYSIKPEISIISKSDCEGVN